MSDPTQSKVSAALTEAQNIVEAAKQKAASILEQARAAEKEAQERGYEEGFQAGKRAASGAAVRLVSETASMRESLSRQAAKLAVKMARHIIGEQAEISSDILRSVAGRALEQSNLAEEVELIVHPADEKAIKKSEELFRRLAQNVLEFHVSTDGSLTRGGCIVRTEFGEVDASIESLLEILTEELGLRGSVESD